MPSSHSTVQTPNPEERSLVVTVEESAFVARGGRIPPPGTPYNDPLFAPYFARDYPAEFNDFVYTTQIGDYGLGFARNKGKTGPDSKTNYTKPFRSTWTKFGNHRWCPILKGLSFVSDTSFPIATNVIENGELGTAIAPRNYVREIFIQEVNEGSRFMLDEFLSPFPFVLGRFPVPQPGRVSYQINGVSGAFEECLHDDIEVPNTDSTTATLFGSSQGVGSSKVPGQFFPRTNFRRRRPYILTADQELQSGVWYMQRLRVFPPRQPRTTVA